VVTNQGGEFGEKLTLLCKAWGTKHVRIVAKNPNFMDKWSAMCKLLNQPFKSVLMSTLESGTNTLVESHAIYVQFTRIPLYCRPQWLFLVARGYFSR
jgi:hypothetical protein